ncbi:zinc metalloprotease HtpX [Chitinispirillales bacterium ANBcel5]|uniref:zinc metalloprotease HtpX n=1 Tax=Cellulosispirillum alkaliphilum TaxID=3039283 RepID=UPI002A588AFB|nr:zinc metalloprotease HtpX [Chitinispirillales bacterium ANBcel5]
MNSIKTTLLLAALTGLLVVFGNMLGGSQGALIALIFAGVMNFVSYWYSDKIVLKMYRAQEVGPSDVPQLYSVVENLARKNGMPMPKVFVINNDSPNAFATGRSPSHASVAATVGILRLLDQDELEGVMAHELAHVKNRDTLISTVAATVAGAITMIATMVRWSAIFGGGMRGSSNNRGNAIGALALAILAPMAALLIQMAISRSREFAADEAGAKMCGKPLALANALTRLHQGARSMPLRGGNEATAHLFIVNPFKGGMTSLFSTHPSMDDRVRKLRELSRQMA